MLAIKRDLTQYRGRRLTTPNIHREVYARTSPGPLVLVDKDRAREIGALLHHGLARNTAGEHISFPRW